MAQVAKIIITDCKLSCWCSFH